MIDKEEIEDLEYQLNLKQIEIYKLSTELKELEEIEKEHQKINGNLQKRITELEGICKGKSIQEMGTSNLYKEDKR